MEPTTILLPGRLPAPAWVVHAGVGVLFLLSGSGAIAAGQAYWVDWVKVIFGGLTLSGMLWVLVQRMRHGAPRLQADEDGLRVRPGPFGALRRIDWADVEGVTLTREEARVDVRGEESAYVRMLSQETVTRVRQLFETAAAERGFEVVDDPTAETSAHLE
jgi:hypothetical protein